MVNVMMIPIKLINALNWACFLVFFFLLLQLCLNRNMLALDYAIIVVILGMTEGYLILDINKHGQIILKMERNELFILVTQMRRL